VLEDCRDRSEAVPPRNGGRPLNISYNTQPNAQMSVLLSTVFPRPCSGLMYGVRACNHAFSGVVDRDLWRWCPSFRPSSVANTFASPKSSTLIVPAGVILMFAGFRSRWMMPLSWASSRASAICQVGEGIANYVNSHAMQRGPHHE
jgi:hypothetical protein